MTLVMIGLSGAGRESLTLGVLDLLRNTGASSEAASPLVLARSKANATIAWLESPDGGVVFDASFDTVPYPAPTDAQEGIADAVLASARLRDVIYVVPGHPVLGERASTQIYTSALAEGIPLRIIALTPLAPLLLEGTETSTRHSSLTLHSSLLTLNSSSRALSDFATLVELMARLRDPVSGCPWDLEQTSETLRRYVIEEAYEVIEAIDSSDPRKIAEELGDLLLQVVFHAQLASEAGSFDIGDVIGQIVDKLIRRHPHVFGDVAVDGSAQVLVNWEKIKRAERGYEDRVSILDGIPKELPALMRALDVSKRVVKVGFEWPDIDAVLDKVEEELTELRAEIAVGNSSRAADELGDLLFTLVNVARRLKVDPEEALRAMTHRFAHRFRRIEAHAAASGRNLSDLSLAEMESVWQEAKREH